MISLRRALALFGSCSDESELQWSQKFWISWIQLFSSSWKWKVRKKYTVLVEPQFSGWLKSIEILKNVTRRAVIVSAWGVLKAFHLFFKFWFYIPTMDVVCIHWLLGRNSQDMSSRVTLPQVSCEIFHKMNKKTSFVMLSFFHWNKPELSTELLCLSFSAQIMGLFFLHFL